MPGILLRIETSGIRSRGNASGIRIASCEREDEKRKRKEKEEKEDENKARARVYVLRVGGVETRRDRGLTFEAGVCNLPGPGRSLS